jgi:hypothetical protein
VTVRDVTVDMSERRTLTVRIPDAMAMRVGCDMPILPAQKARLRLANSLRVVVISSKPSGWKALSMAHSDDVYVLAAPSFGCEIVDALRATPPTLPHA